jgi:RNA polymerase sigma-70 factor (ECF subfamily)
VSAFELLYRNELPNVYGLSLRMTGDEQHAAELTQDIFVRAWDELAKFRGGNFGAWIYTLGRNLILNDQRTRSRFSRLISFEDDVAAVEPLGARVSRETALTIAAAVETLSPRAKSIFTMHDVEGYSAVEIGELLGIEPSTVRVHLHRARQRLAEILVP